MTSGGGSPFRCFSLFFPEFTASEASCAAEILGRRRSNERKKQQNTRPSDRPTAARDDDGFAALNLVEDLQQMRLRFRGLNISLEWSG